MNLTDKQIAELWGEEGPYSEVKHIVEHRILDDSISRIFLKVEVNINPFTFKIIKKNRKEFINDEMINMLLDHAHYLGFEDGYISIPFSHVLSTDNNNDITKQAEKILVETMQAVIRMHKYVIKIINKPAFTIRIK